MSQITPIGRADLPPNRLRELRKSSGLKRAQIAAHVDRDPQTLWRWERREMQIPDEAKEKLADLFGVSIAWLMGWEPDPSSLPIGEEAA